MVEMFLCVIATLTSVFIMHLHCMLALNHPLPSWLKLCCCETRTPKVQRYANDYEVVSHVAYDKISNVAEQNGNAQQAAIVNSCLMTIFRK
jgi:hypothetical protein